MSFAGHQEFQAGLGSHSPPDRSDYEMPIKRDEDEFFPFEPEPDGEFFDKKDTERIEQALWDQCKIDGYIKNPMDWPQRDSYTSLYMEARDEAHKIAKKKGIDVEAAWHKTRRRVQQATEGVLKHHLNISRHYSSLFRKCFAIAATVYPNDYRNRFKLAQMMALDHSDKRTEEAWLAFTSYSQESLFDDSVYAGRASNALNPSIPTTLLDVVPDATSTGEDPASIQSSFLDYALSDESIFTERQKDIIELLAFEGMSHREIAKKIGVSNWTVSQDIKKIKLSGITSGWLPDIAEEDEDPKDQALSS
tara:strand:+ start:738 stop:1655 length:918 start_codon:yes stop_codon:yes gene_type:complete